MKAESTMADNGLPSLQTRSSAIMKLSSLSIAQRPIFAIPFLLLLSGSVELAWVKTMPFGLGFDSGGYFGVARWMVGLPHNMWNIREYYSKGLPAFLDLAGLFWRDDFRLIKLLLALMATVMPAMVFLVLLSSDRRVALPGALLFVISGIPFVFSWEVMTDHLHLFFLLSSLTIFSFMMRSRSIAWPIFLGLSLSLTWYTRPISLLIPGLFIGILIIYRGSFREMLRRNVVHGVVIGGIVVGCFVAGSAYHSALEKRPFHLGVTQNYAANQMLLAYYVIAPNYFVLGTDRPVKPIIVPSNGPATAEFFQLLRHALKVTTNWQGSDVSKPFGDDPDKFAQDMIDHPRLIYFYYMMWQIDPVASSAEVDPLVSRVVREAIIAHPKLFRYMAWNFMQALGPKSWLFNNDKVPLYITDFKSQYWSEDYSEFVRNSFKNLLGAGALREASSVKPRSNHIAIETTRLVTRALNIDDQIKPGLVALVLVGFILTIRRRNYLLPLCVGGILYYTILPSLIMIPQLRYSIPPITFMIIGVVLVITPIASRTAALVKRRGCSTLLM